MKPEQLHPKLTPFPCPFCGRLPSVLPTRPDVEGNAWGAVQCMNERCPAQPTVRDGAQVADSRGSGAYRDLAIKRWNRRKP
jgi:hypothetical protein